ncbi:hypothetical protein MVEN_01855100 [Mycena venus]|uniref:Uncharacterized protein n=1 Tax=Mycena venus TaxID=2733690 RepID=A0A8H7CKL8_9AGAR|nr:hypothetical protein MVEN_01855100 [Mycena venus]
MSGEHVSAAGLSLSESHPLSEELSSLRALVTRFQNEAHASSIKLQRHALDTSAYTERIAQLEAENALLTTELGVLRDNPVPSSSSSSSSSTSGPDTVAELTLSLRRLNAKLSLTEAALAEHTRALGETTALAAQQTHAAGEAYALAARARGREEEGRQREDALKRWWGEYAALVRSLERRSPPASATRFSFSGPLHGRSASGGGSVGGGSTPTLVDPSPSPGTPEDALALAKSQLGSLIENFAEQNAVLSAQAFAMESERDVVQAQLAAARALVGELGTELAKAKFEVEKARVDDRSAAGMVERYMKFTQQTTTSLHASLGARCAPGTPRRWRRCMRRWKRWGGSSARGRGRYRPSAPPLTTRHSPSEERVRRALGGAVGRVPPPPAPTPAEDGGNGGDTEKGDERAGEALARLVADVRAVLGMLDAPTGSGSDESGGNGGGEQDQDQGTEGRMRVLEDAVGMLVAELEAEVGRRVGAEREMREAREREGERDEADLLPSSIRANANADADGGESETLAVTHVVDGNGVAGGVKEKAERIEEDKPEQGKGEEVAERTPTAVAEGDGDGGGGDSEVLLLVVEGKGEAAEAEAAQAHALDDEDGEAHNELERELEDGAEVREEREERVGSAVEAEEVLKTGNADADAEPMLEMLPAIAPEVDDASAPAPAIPADDATSSPSQAESENSSTSNGANTTLAEGSTHTDEEAATAPALEPAIQADDPALSPLHVESENTTANEADTPSPKGSTHTDEGAPRSDVPVDIVSSDAASPPSSAPAPVPVVAPSDAGEDDLNEAPRASPLSTAPAPSIAFPSAAKDVPPSPATQDNAPAQLGSEYVEQAPTEPQAADAAADAPTPTHPLLADLAETSKRYDALQRAFRDCHIVLQELRATLAPGSTSSPSHGETQAQTQGPQTDVLRTVVERLHDYTEDARVELEIRVADGRVLARGWETIVLLPGTPNGRAGEHTRDGSAEGEGGGDADVRRQIAAYVARDADAQAGFRRKLEDVEHDIAVVKRAVYAPPSAPAFPTSESVPTLMSPSPVSPSPKTEGWAAWLAGTGGSERRTPPSPSPGFAPGEAPTFGSVMTSPRLRHSASAARLAKAHAHVQGNPFESLGLRVPMPAYVPQQQQQQQQQQAAPRQRTISGVYMLGLGVGHAAHGRRPSGLAMPPNGRGTGVGRGEDEGDVE